MDTLTYADALPDPIDNWVAVTGRPPALALDLEALVSSDDDEHLELADDPETAEMFAIGLLHEGDRTDEMDQFETVEDAAQALVQASVRLSLPVRFTTAEGSTDVMSLAALSDWLRARLVHTLDDPKAALESRQLRIAHIIESVVLDELFKDDDHITRD